MPFAFLIIAYVLGGVALDNPYLVEAFEEGNFTDSLIGGSVVPHSDYPELVYLVNGLGERCSGSIVGPKVILTAAHCVDSVGNVLNYFNGPDFPKFYAHCDMTPQYASGGEDLDFALCKNLAGPILNAKPATLSKVAVTLGETITLVGYGCVIPGGGGGNDGTLKAGYAQVTQTPLPPNNDWFWTEAKDAALCFGDSGGPVFKKGTHSIIGVNSRGNIHDVSLLTAMYLPRSRAFMKSWAKKNKVGICGINLKCRQPVNMKFLNDTINDVEDEDTTEGDD